MPTQPPRSLAARLSAAPKVHDAEAAARGMADLGAAIAEDAELAALAMALESPGVRALVEGVFSGSPFLTGTILRHPRWLFDALITAPEERLQALASAVETDLRACQAMPEAMPLLRTYKAEAALVIALADIGGVMEVMRTAEAISVVADVALLASVEFLLRRGVRAGEVLLPDAPGIAAQAGYVVLGMGKFGARELNYSSDIDLIVLFDRERLRLREGLEPQAFAVRLTRDLVRLMQERTAQGYVFRTDLRLRPDPGATQVALSTTAAFHYYESFGQNWERAALIKARRSRRRHRGRQRLPVGNRALHLAEVSRLRRHLRHPRHEAPDQRLQGLRCHRGRRPQHQARPWRHPRDRVLRPDPAADRRRPAEGVAAVADARGA